MNELNLIDLVLFFIYFYRQQWRWRNKFRRVFIKYEQTDGKNRRQRRDTSML